MSPLNQISKEEIEKSLDAISHIMWGGAYKLSVEEYNQLHQHLSDSHLRLIDGIIERLETVRINSGTGINAIPTSDDYAKGWNHCRQEAFDKRETFLQDQINYLQSEKENIINSLTPKGEEHPFTEVHIINCEKCRSQGK